MAESKDKYIKTTDVADKVYGGKGKVGSFKESRGGGTPSGEKNAFGKKIKIYPEGEGREGWHSVGEPGSRNEQPRDAKGRFEYNAVNGKETKYPGRGKTIPGSLVGAYDDKSGKRIKIEDFESGGFLSGREYFKEKGYVPFSKGEKVAFEGKVKVLTISQFQIAQGYYGNMTAGKFIDESVEKFMKEKTTSRGAGRYSKEEKAAAEASKEGKGAFGVEARGEEGRAVDKKYQEKEKAKEETEKKQKEQEKKEYKEKQEFREKHRYSNEDIESFKDGYTKFLMQTENISEDDATKKINSMEDEEILSKMDEAFEDDKKEPEEMSEEEVLKELYDIKPRESK